MCNLLITNEDYKVREDKSHANRRARRNAGLDLKREMMRKDNYKNSCIKPS